MTEQLQALADLTTEAFRALGPRPATSRKPLCVRQGGPMMSDAAYRIARVGHLLALLGQLERERDVPPSRAIEVTERGEPDKVRWCEEQGEHTWVPDESASDNEYWCEVCGAYGQLVRPMGARR